MSPKGLSGLNAAYISNIKNSSPSVSASEAPKPAVQKENGDNKLKNALIGLGIAGVLTALGVGIYCLSNGRGKTPKIAAAPPSIPKTPQAPDTSKITGIPAAAPAPQPAKNIQTPPAAQQKPIAPNPIPVQKPVSKAPDGVSIEKIGNGRIQIVRVQNGVQHKPVELPEYLYHITSKTSMDKITSSGTLKISENEQLKGLYLLDSENFLTHYGSTTVNGQNKDLLTAIFRQANRGNKGLPVNQQELVVIKIPTADLLKKGKLRIRTQEDFFAFTNILQKVEKKTGKKFTLRGLCDDTKGEEFRKLVLDNNLMPESDLNRFLRDMKIKIHYGHTLSSAVASDLENKYSVEYIFNHDIKLSEFPNITVQTINPYDYAASNTSRIDPTKARSIFEGKFSPLQPLQKTA